MASVATLRGRAVQTYSALSWSPDGQFLAAASENTVFLWDIHTLLLLWNYKHSTRVNAVAWSPDSMYIASSSQGQPILIWQARTSELKGLGKSDVLEEIHALAWSPGGHRLISGNQKGSLQLWDSHKGAQLAVYDGHTAAVLTVAWSPDGRYVASGSEDAMVRVWRDPALFA